MSSKKARTGNPKTTGEILQDEAMAQLASEIIKGMQEAIAGLQANLAQQFQSLPQGVSQAQMQA